MKLILDGIITIHEATSYKYKIKYNYLLNKFKDAGLVKQSNDIWQSSIVQEEIKILYIQPHILNNDKGKEILNFKQLSKHIKDCYRNSDLMEELSSSLSKWSDD